MYSEKTLKIVKQNLLDDLKKWINIDTSEFDIDFSEALGEGSEVDFNGEFVESCSEITILDKNKNIIGGGWIDHLRDQNNKLYSYWTYCDFKYGDVSFSNKYHLIPDHLWDEFSEETRNYLAKTHQGWHGDTKLNKYRIKYYPQEILEAYNKVLDILPDIDNLEISKEAGRALASLLDRSRTYLSGEELEYQNNRDVYIIENDIKYKLFERQKSSDIITILDKLENLINFGRIVFPKLPNNYLVD